MLYGLCVVKQTTILGYPATDNTIPLHMNRYCHLYVNHF